MTLRSRGGLMVYLTHRLSRWGSGFEPGLWIYHEPFGEGISFQVPINAGPAWELKAQAFSFWVDTCAQRRDEYRLEDDGDNTL